MVVTMYKTSGWKGIFIGLKIKKRTDRGLGENEEEKSEKKKKKIIAELIRIIYELLRWGKKMKAG